MFIYAIAWERIRLNLLIITGCSILLGIGKSILFPPIIQPETVLKYRFPDIIALASWKSLPSQPLDSQYPVPSELISSRSYRYSKANVTLTIEMRYAIEKGGGIIEFVKHYTPVNSSAMGIGTREDRYQESTGFYTLFTNKNTAYLLSCINPRGGSTIRSEQFNSNRYRYDLNFNRIVNWVVGKGNIRDMRCLWTQLSIPLKQISQNQAYSLLESAWIDWYKWWYPRFPKEY